MRKLTCIPVVLFFLAFGCSQPANRFTITFTDSVSSEPLDGRLLLILANNDQSEPRFQIGDGLKTQLVFGVDVDGWAPGQEKTLDGNALGFPIRSIADIPPGEYFVQ